MSNQNPTPKFNITSNVSNILLLFPFIENIDTITEFIPEVFGKLKEISKPFLGILYESLPFISSLINILHRKKAKNNKSIKKGFKAFNYSGKEIDPSKLKINSFFYINKKDANISFWVLGEYKIESSRKEGKFIVKMIIVIPNNFHNKTSIVAAYNKELNKNFARLPSCHIPTIIKTYYLQ